uniref:DUF6598 domain-containing protein n=1 Tax=Oryza barthii TaxID=65489 RepID=A0A0D3HH55_9ORYZ
MAAEKTKQRRGIEESARMRDKGRLSDETPSEEGHEIIRFRRGWESLYSHPHRSFDATTFAPMRYTHVPIPKYADCNYGLQIFSVKVNQLLLNEEEEEEEGLHWPLHVYGLVATRDSLDHRHNLLFNRTRDNCQILTQQDPFLLLTGPTRAVVLIDPVKFEIQLKAKGTNPPFIVRRRRRCKRSELEFALALLLSVQVVDGSSWPDDLGVQVAARTASISDEAIKLLDSRSAHGGRVPICPDDGVIKLSRRVVSVELAGGLEVDYWLYIINSLLMVARVAYWMLLLQIRSVSHLKGLQPAVGYNKPTQELGVVSPDLGVRIRTSRGLVLDDGDFVDDDHLLEHGEQFHLHYLLGHVPPQTTSHSPPPLHPRHHHTTTSGDDDGSSFHARRTTSYSRARRTTHTKELKKALVSFFFNCLQRQLQVLFRQNLKQAEKTKQRRGIEESARMRDKGRLSDETPSEEGHEIIRFRRGWESLYSHPHRSFDATINQLLLNEEEEEGLHWPLHVYGLIITRDSLDPRRNLLFNRTRDNCQILTQQDPFLLLTGPTRAVVLIDPVKFEIQLKAKGTSESEDKVLNFRVLVYHHDYSLADPPFIVRRRRRCKRSELEFALALLLSVQVVDGSSWPDDLGVQVAARTASISDEAIKLLDSRSAHGGRVPICPDDGVIKLSRRVVSVELAGGLEVDVLALHNKQLVDGSKGGLLDVAAADKTIEGLRPHKTIVPVGPYPAMRYTFGHIPKSSFVGCDSRLQIFSIKLLRNTSTTDHQLQWPLHVYGLVATRDSLDPRRNLLFNRTRDNCQILTQQDPFLVLTGPSRAIVLIDPVQFEFQLKAKSNNNTLHDHPDQDQIVNFGVVNSGYLPGPTSHCIGKRNGKMPIDDDGFIQLSRRVVSVELAGQLIVQVLAFNSQQQQQVVDNDNDNKKDEIVAKHEIVFDPKEASLSVETCELQLGGGGGGPCKLQISVAWSLVDRLPPVVNLVAVVVRGGWEPVPRIDGLGGGGQKLAPRIDGLGSDNSREPTTPIDGLCGEGREPTPLFDGLLDSNI